MRKIAANYIYRVSAPPIKNGYLTLSDQGEILAVSEGGETLHEIAGLEYYSGVLIPGFINAHCHLELSHLKGQMEQGLGLAAFIHKVPTLRNQAECTIQDAIGKALRFMWSRGINGLGDVVNTHHTITAKRNSKLMNHSFLEVFSMKNMPIQEIIQKAQNLKTQFEENKLSVSYSPHSFYGTDHKLNQELWRLMSAPHRVSIHYKEHPDEACVDSLPKIQTLLKQKFIQNLLLVHNIYINQDELDSLSGLPENNKEKIYWTLCPNSNLFIEKQLPPVGALIKTGLPICLGTDSLASNPQLSVFEEMKTLLNNFPELPFELLLQWATLNGAKALQMDTVLGSFEPGKKPGVLLINGFDFKNKTLSKTSEIIRLV
jgi:cytosine/adenosine deaminase-related metal-dependent hydrolase